MKVAIIGAGRLARAVQAALARRDVEAQMHSRSTGFDVLSTPPTHALGDVDVVVEATDIFTQRAGTAKDFFVRSTRAVAAAARVAGAKKHILIPIVNCEKPELRGSGYYAGKAEQERIARAEQPNLTVVRSTLWHEFARQNLNRLRFGPLAPVPSMTVQPIALDAVAGVVAECAVGRREGAHCDIAGPGITTLWDMTEALPRKGALLVPLPLPGAAGRALRDGSLLPGPDVEILGPSFGEWLASDPAPARPF